MDRAVSLEARRVDLATEPPFCLGPTRIDPTGHQATVRGRSQRLQPQTLKVLIALHDKSGQAVTREELIERCWDGRIVGDDVINRCISILRRFSAEVGGFRIETVPRSGYRLVEIQIAERSAKRSGWIAPAVIAALTLAAAGTYIVKRAANQNEEYALTASVLPLTEDSGGRDIHEIAAATRASVLNAMADGGYPTSLIEPRSDHRATDLIVSGDIRRDASTIQAFVQVEEMPHGVIVYSQRFEADENSARTLPDQIGASVAANLSWAATLMKLDRDHPSDPAVTAELLKAGSFNPDGRDMLRVYEVAHQVAPKAPDSVIAQLSLATATGAVLDELPREQRPSAIEAGRRALDRAMVLAPKFGDAYAPWCGLHGGEPVARCEDHLREALRIDPDAPVASTALSGLLDGVGRIDEALKFAQLSLAKDPYMPTKLARMIRIVEEQGDDDDADQLFRRSMRWWPNQPVIIWNRLVGIEFHGDYRALERFEGEVGTDDLPLNRDVATKLIGAVRVHDRSAALRACRGDKMGWTTQSLCMTALADLGEAGRAYAIAFKLFPPVHPRDWPNQPPGFAVAALSSPAAKSLRRDPRFLALADGSGLLAYWRTGRLPDFCKTTPEPVCASIVRRRA